MTPPTEASEARGRERAPEERVGALRTLLLVAGLVGFILAANQIVTSLAAAGP